MFGWLKKKVEETVEESRESWQKHWREHPDRGRHWYVCKCQLCGAEVGGIFKHVSGAKWDAPEKDRYYFAEGWHRQCIGQPDMNRLVNVFPDMVLHH